MSAKGKPGSELLRFSISKHALMPLTTSLGYVLSTSQSRLPARPKAKWCPPHVPLMTLQPVLNWLSSDAQKEAVARFRFAPPTRATTCASVMKEPSTVRLPPCNLKVASSILTFTARPGAEKKQYCAP